LLAWGFCLAVALGGVTMPIVLAIGGTTWWSPARVVLYGIVPPVLAAVCIVMVRLGDSTRKLFFAYGIAIAAALLGADAYFAREINVARAAPLPKIHGIGKPHAGGIRVLPNVCGVTFGLPAPALQIAGKPIQPLGGVSNNLLNPDADSGDWRFSDQYGFNNPPGQWSDPVDLLAVGDSFTFGLDVPIGHGYIDRLRDRVGKTVNLGCGGNGPLLELASLVEYGPLARPATVLWAYFEGNDITSDLPAEQASPILPRYLLPDFTQDLARGQPGLDAAMIRFIEMKVNAIAANAHVQPDYHFALGPDHLKLEYLRIALGLSHRYDARAIESFRRILIRARTVTSSWGGRLVFVYLPDEARYAGLFGGSDAEAYAAPLKSMVSGLDIPIVDVSSAFAADAQPRRLFHGHYTEAGYGLVADTVARALSQSRQP
jgi:hypothetical protein